MWWDRLRSEATWEVEVVPARLRTTHGANPIRPNARTTLTSHCLRSTRTFDTKLYHHLQCLYIFEYIQGHTTKK